MSSNPEPQPATASGSGDSVPTTKKLKPKKEKESSTPHSSPFALKKDLADPRAFCAGISKQILNALESHGYPVFTNASQVADLPTRLRSSSEFCVCPLYDPVLIDACASLGFFPMTIPIGLGMRVFAAKIHKQRAVTTFCPELEYAQRPPKSGIFIPQGGTRKKSRNFVLCVNVESTFEAVCKMIYDQHGEDWLTGQLRQCFYHMFKHPSDYRMKIHVFAVALPAAPTEGTEQPYGEIIAGELGYTVGNCYTSLTGAFTVDGAGSVQLATMGLLLEQLGYKAWDLGMQMDYKAQQLHTTEWGRKKWLTYIKEFKDTSTPGSTAGVSTGGRGRVPPLTLSSKAAICPLEALPSSLRMIRCRDLYRTAAGSGSSSCGSGPSPLTPPPPTSEGTNDNTALTVSPFTVQLHSVLTVVQDSK